MIACNACQLLATNLPVCHRPPREASLGPFMSILTGLFLRLGAIAVQVGFKRLFNSQHDLLWRCLTCSLYCNLQSILGFGVSMLLRFFTRFEAQDGSQIRLNLVGLPLSSGILNSSLGYVEYLDVIIEVLICFYVEMVLIF